MADDDFSIDVPFEPCVEIPKASLISAACEPSRRTTPESICFKHISISKPLNKGKFPVFLAKCKDRKERYALKLFPSKDKNSQKCFKNEVRFAILDHPNIVKIVHSEKERIFKQQNAASVAAFIMTEFAPYGDLLDFVVECHTSFTEDLVRTYFRQLIEGLEYLHAQNIAHLDIKLENILIGENYTLKIADFDLSCFLKDARVLTRGTEYYRAPEMINDTCRDGRAADIYSAGIILFVLKSGGIAPHTEYTPYKGINLMNLLNNENQEFWRQHCKIQEKSPSFFSEEFKELVNGMMRSNPEERFSIQDIKNSEWYKGKVYTSKELSSVMKNLMNK